MRSNEDVGSNLIFALTATQGVIQRQFLGASLTKVCTPEDGEPKLKISAKIKRVVEILRRWIF